ncbi:MAG: hypothetical protein EOP11_12150, partial [Proteobacteria bacterium]
MATCEALKAEEATAHASPTNADDESANLTTGSVASAEKTMSSSAKPSSGRSPGAETPANASVKPPAKPKNDFASATKTNRDGAVETESGISEVEKSNEEIGKMGKAQADAALKRANELIKAKPAASGPEKSRLRNDRNLALQARSTLEAGKVYPKQAAEKAVDAKVKSNLLGVSMATASKVVLEKEETRLTDQLAKLLGLASVATKRGDAMESNSAISGAIPKAAAAAGKPEGAIEAEEKAPASIAREDSVSAK